MAKLTSNEWRDIRNAYEVDMQSTVVLAKKYGIADTTIQRRMKKDGWNRQKTQDAIEKKVISTKAFIEITQENAGVTQVVNNEVERRLKLEGIFMDSLEYNQAVANKLLKNEVSDGSVGLNAVQVHSQITNRNKDGVLGKPQTQVNIQNNVGTDADAVIQRLMERHQPCN